MPRCFSRANLRLATAAPPARTALPGVDYDALALINILNSKLSIFLMAFLPQFVSTTDPHALSRMLGLSGVFMLLTFVIFAGYGLFAAAMRHQVLSRLRVMTWLRRRLRPSVPDWPWPTVDGSQTRSLLRPKERGSGLARHSLSPLQ